MFYIEFFRRIGLLLFIIGIVSFASTKTVEGTDWLSVLLFWIGGFLYLLPNREKE